MIESIPISEINRKVLISFLATALALCMGFLPIPFAVVICYPPVIVLGIVSLVCGAIALREIRVERKRGRRLALAAIWLGRFMLLVAVCIIIAGILIVPRFMNVIQEAWHQVPS